MRDCSQPAETPSLLFAALEGGGTKFVCAIGRSPAQVIERATIPTTDPAATLAACIDFFHRMAQRHGRLSALGIACFGPLQLHAQAPDFGCLLSTPKPGWSGARVLGPLQQALGVPASIDTDVGSAAEAEWRMGAGQDAGSLAYVTVGTGIGAAVAPGNRAAQRLMHPEMGHIPVRRDPRDDFPGCCSFHADCLEGLASGPAIRARWNCDLSDLPQDHPGRSIIAGYLGQLAAAITLMHAVDRIAMGGGVMSDGSLLPLVRKATHAHLGGYLQSLRTHEQVNTFLCRPALGDDAAIAGAMLQAQSLRALKSR